MQIYPNRFTPTNQVNVNLIATTIPTNYQSILPNNSTPTRKRIFNIHPSTTFEGIEQIHIEIFILPAIKRSEASNFRVPAVSLSDEVNVAGRYHPTCQLFHFLKSRFPPAIANGWPASKIYVQTFNIHP